MGLPNLIWVASWGTVHASLDTTTPQLRLVDLISKFLQTARFMASITGK